MRRLILSDILNILEYERVRAAFREKIIALKKHRRTSVGECITLVFENRETVKFQIQEMARIERLTVDAQIQAELDSYNVLIPEAGCLSATLLVDITEQSKIRETLDSLVGLHRMTTIEFGGDRIPAEFDPSQFTDDRISAVQYVTFRFSPEQRVKFSTREIPARIVISHPAYQREVAIDGELRRELIGDLN